jgi:hypothetical protein
MSEILRLPDFSEKGRNPFSDYSYTPTPSALTASVMVKAKLNISQPV